MTKKIFEGIKLVKEEPQMAAKIMSAGMSQLGYEEYAVIYVPTNKSEILVRVKDNKPWSQVKEELIQKIESSSINYEFVA